MAREYISWIRVSTKRQGISALGLDAQREIIQTSMGGITPIAEFKDIYTGTILSKCTELRKAINMAKGGGYLLVVAKADRFRTDIEALQILDEMGEENIRFCDSPGSSRLILTVLFAVYRQQAYIGRINTKNALRQIQKKIDTGEPHYSKVSKNRVTQLGRPRGLKAKEGWADQSVAQKTASKDRIGSNPIRRRQWLLMSELRNRGDSLVAIAGTLNATGERTPSGQDWTKGSVSHALNKWSKYFEK